MTILKIIIFLIFLAGVWPLEKKCTISLNGGTMKFKNVNKSNSMLETIKLWWAATTAKWANNRLIRIQHQLKRDSTSAINLMEFNGDVYISYNGTPVVSTEFINLQSVEVLEAARKTWIDYRLSEMDIENKTA